MAKIVKGTEYKKSMDLSALIESELPSSVETPDTRTKVIERESLEATGLAKGILEEAKSEAARIRQEAKDIFTKIEEEQAKSKKEGYDKGYQEGLEKSLEMLVRVKEMRQKLFTDNEKEIIQLIFDIAKKVIGREFSHNDKAMINVIRLALNDAIGEKIVVRLNPEDFLKVKEHESELLQNIEGSKTLSLREKSDIEPGGCIIETEIGTIDAKLDTQLNAIKKALGLES